MEKIQGKTLILNGKLADISAFNPERSAGLYYEVIRVMEGRPLFLEDHLARLESSCRKANVNLPELATIRNQIHHLITYLSIEEGNIKPVIYREKGNWLLCCYQVPHVYPKASDYLEGVPVKTFSYVRPAPTIKRWNEDFRSKVNDFIRDEGIYEAILVNESGYLTEGSRSNLFFFDRSDRLITAPETIILPGITRKYVLQACRALNIEVLEDLLTIEGAEDMAACFISGTSPKILPVRKLDKVNYSADHTILRKIMAWYDELINSRIGE